MEALADPTRRRIVELLSVDERAAGHIAEEFDVSKPAISRHLRVLRDAGVVSARVDAQRRIYRLEPAALDDLDAWLHHIRTAWNRRLDALEAHLNDH